MATFFRAVTGQQSQLAVVLSTLGIAALFTPLHRRIQNEIDRRFYRRRYDTEQIIAAYSAALRNEVELEQLIQTLLAIIKESLQPAHVSCWLYPTLAALRNKPKDEQRERRAAAGHTPA